MNVSNIMRRRAPRLSCHNNNLNGVLEVLENVFRYTWASLFKAMEIFLVPTNKRRQCVRWELFWNPIGQLPHLGASDANRTNYGVL
jgi:hypothetical protein